MTILETVPRLWLEEFKIHSYEIGPSGYATPQSICRFLQEAASNHAAAFSLSAEELAREQQMWVLSNLSLRMQTYPRWGQTMRLETWPVHKGSSVRGYRDFNIFAEDGALLGQAATMWILLSMETRKPQRIPAWVTDIASPGNTPEILSPIKESELPSAATKTEEFVILASNIDWNMHVNNVCYLEWSLEAIAPRFRLANKITELDMSFVAEGHYGNTAVTQCFANENDPDAYLHRVLEKESGKTLALVRAKWHPK